MGKTGVPGEKPLRERERTNNKLNPHLAPTPGPRPDWWKASAVTTAPQFALVVCYRLKQCRETTIIIAMVLSKLCDLVPLLIQFPEIEVT